MYVYMVIIMIYHNKLKIEYVVYNILKNASDNHFSHSHLSSFNVNSTKNISHYNNITSHCYIVKNNLI